MKKKAALISLFVVLLALTVTGSLAYFMADDDIENVVTFGTIKVVQFEKEHDAQGNLQDFTQGQYMYPIVNVDHPEEDEHYIEKLVTVKNTGTSEVYVRTFIAYPEALGEHLVLDVDKTGKWLFDKQWNSVMIDGCKYAVISYTYGDALESGMETDAVLLGVYLESETDAQVNPETGKKEFCVLNTDGSWLYSGYSIDKPLHILTVTQASQTTGLSDDPQQALNTAFMDSAPDFN